MRSAFSGIVLLALILVLAGCDDPSSGAAQTATDAPSQLDAGDSRRAAGDATCVAEDGEPRTPRTWKVKKGESLRRIAQRVYGDENLWKSLRDANPGRVDKDGDVRAGVELLIPFDGI